MEVDFRKLVIIVLGIFLVAGLLTATPLADNIDKNKVSVGKADKIFEKVSWAKYKDLKNNWEKLKLKHKIVNKILDTNEGKDTAIDFVKGLASRMVEKIDTWKEKKLVQDSNFADAKFEEAKDKINEIVNSLDANMPREEFKTKIKELKNVWKDLVHKNRLYTAEKFSNKASNVIEKMDSLLNKLNSRIETWESMNVDVTVVKEKYNLAVESTANAKAKLDFAIEKIQSAWDSDDVKLQEVNIALKNLNIAVHKAAKDIKEAIKEEVKLEVPEDETDSNSQIEDNENTNESANQAEDQNEVEDENEEDNSDLNVAADVNTSANVDVNETEADVEVDVNVDANLDLEDEDNS